MSIKHRLIRGARIVQQLAETSLGQLRQQTLNFRPPASDDARQNAVNQVQVRKIELTPARQSQNLSVKITVGSQDGHTYQPSLMFNEVMFDDSDQADNVSFKAVDNREYHIVPIDLNKSNVKVHCNCLDFYYRFAKHNSTDGSLLGTAPPPYFKKMGSTRPSANPQQVPGLCKHLLKSVDTLKQVGILR